MPLTNDELTVVLPLAFPLPVAARESFIEAVETALAAHATRGVGLAHRLAVQLQPAYFSPPPRKSSPPQFFRKPAR
jgi:hypothetical protein